MLHFPLIIIILLLTPQTEPLAPSPTVFLPLHLDNATGVYLVDIPRDSPLKPIQFLLDINSRFFATPNDSRGGFLSSSYHYPQCKSKACILTGNDHFCRNCSASDKPFGCHKTVCFVMLIDPVAVPVKTEFGDVVQDTLAVIPIRSSIPGPPSFVPDFVFTIAPTPFFQRLPKNVKGFAGFNSDPIAIPNQITSAYGFAPNFTMCLPSRKKPYGGVFFGELPTEVTPQKPMKYVSFTVDERFGEYFLAPVNTIIISGISNSLLSLAMTPKQSTGTWTTMISTTAPYTALERTLFMGFSKGFVRVFGASVATPVHPFGVCFDKLPASVATPEIDLVMKNHSDDKAVSWRVLGSKSLIKVREGKWCLAFIDGGIDPKATVVLGAYQLQDHVLEFDLNRSRLGFVETPGCHQFDANLTMY